MSEPADPPPRPERIRALQGGVSPALALLAGMQLDLFSAIGDEAHTADEVARRLGVDTSRVQRLLYALVRADLLTCEGGRFGNTAEARTFLVRGRDGFIGDEHQLLSELWRADLCTAASIRDGKPAAKHDFSVSDEAASAAFFRGLVPSTLAFGSELAGVADFGRIGSVIDIGGGPGGALWALGARHPRLRLTLFELPAGVRLARTIADGDTRAADVVYEAGDITRSPPVATQDAAILKAVIQVLSPDQAAAVIRNTFASLNPNGTLFISGAGILADDRLSPEHAVFYNLTFLNLYDAGRSYTHAVYSGWLEAAGFIDILFNELPSGSTLISARRP